MSENIEQMKFRHSQEIAELQQNCQHVEVSDWMRWMWAPGHFAGRVRTCLWCGKTIEWEEKHQ